MSTTERRPEEVALDALAVVTLALEDGSEEQMGYQVGIALGESIHDIPADALDAVGQLAGWLARVAALALRQREAETGQTPGDWIREQSLHLQSEGT